MGYEAARQRKRANRAVHVAAPHRGEDLGHATQPLRVQAERLRRVGEPELSRLAVEREPYRDGIGQEYAFGQREPDERLGDLQVVRFFQGRVVRGCRESHAAARRVVSVDVRDQQPKTFHVLQAVGDLGCEKHVAALVDVGGELGHGRGGVERQPVAESPARQVGDGAHR